MSSGRVYRGFHAYSPEFINAPVLLANGAMAYDYACQRIVFQNGIGDEGIEPMRTVAKHFPDLSVEFFPFEKAYAMHMTQEAQRHFTNMGIPYEQIDDPTDAPRPWVKVMLGGEPNRVAQVQAFLRECFPEISFLPTNGGYLEVLQKGVDKGTGLLALADAVHISREHVYAIGDGYNDVAMLHTVQKAFVPANGEAEALSCADVVVPSNDEGAVAYVVKWLNNWYGDR